MAFKLVSSKGIKIHAKAFQTVACRKYDVEMEALKLYGEDLYSVLQRFRKTPDYLKILNDKSEELRQHLHDIGVQTLYFYVKKIRQRVADLLGQENVEDVPTTMKTPSFFRSPFNLRRQASADRNISGVEILDSYSKLSSHFAVGERNAFKDLGFEYAGNIIHSIIKSMGPDDAPAKSTRLPFGGEFDKKVTKTTEHEHVHEVKTTVQGPDSTVAPDTSTTPETFRYRYRATHKKTR